MHTINVGDLTIGVDRKDIKNIHLSVYPPDGRVHIATPLQVDDDTLRLFAVSKIRWIRQERQKMAEQLRQSRRLFIDGETHYFAGQPYLLKVIEVNAPAKVEISGKDHLFLYVRPGADRDQREKVLHNWYRQELKKQVPELVAKWEKRMQVEVKDFGIRRMKTKWGTCNIAVGRIWLNLELAKKPLRCLEYILVHEMTHLLVRHHNEEFKGYMDLFLPHWRGLREEVNSDWLGFVEWD